MAIVTTTTDSNGVILSWHPRERFQVNTYFKYIFEFFRNREKKNIIEDLYYV